ncbi:MAG: hypothetical protein GYB68_00005, partial [Chloroflexi bacterium]|nr:hypothetical protein [Chloroflexota bacterium]
ATDQPGSDSGGIGGPIQPTAAITITATALPDTGLLDTTGGFVALGLAAFALVAVVMVVRRLRMK